MNSKKKQANNNTDNKEKTSKKKDIKLTNNKSEPNNKQVEKEKAKELLKKEKAKQKAEQEAKLKKKQEEEIKQANIKLNRELELLKEQLAQEKSRLQESQLKNVELQRKIKQIDLSKQPKYHYTHNSISQDIIDEIGTIIQHGIFNKSRIANLLGINRNTILAWLKKAEDENEQNKPNSLYVQLKQVMDKNREIFFLKNQLAIEKEAIQNNNWNAAKWNIESRFPELRTTASNRQTSITIPTENPYASPNNKALTDEEKTAQDVKKEITFLIRESILGSEDVSSETDYQE